MVTVEHVRLMQRPGSNKHQVAWLWRWGSCSLTICQQHLHFIKYRRVSLKEEWVVLNGTTMSAKKMKLSSNRIPTVPFQSVTSRLSRTGDRALLCLVHSLVKCMYNSHKTSCFSAGSRPWDKGGPGLPKKFSLPFGPQFGLKIKGSRAP